MRTQLLVGVAKEPGSQVFSRFAADQVFAEQPLDCFRDKRGWATVADGARDGGMLAHRSTEAEVVSIGQFAFVLDFLAFHADVCDPVLAASIGASGHMEAELLIELRKTLFHFVDEPAREALGFSDGQFAELSAGAGDSSAKEEGAFDLKADLSEFANQFAQSCGLERR